MSGEEITVEALQSIGEIDAGIWDALGREDDPFTEHAFLQCLEESASVGRDAGWMPLHILARQGEQVVGAAPLYLKSHSYGEYIFDWSWAEAAQRARIPYFPKLVSAVPFTPVTGRRLRTGPGALVPEVAHALLDGMHGVAQAVNAQSVHLLFLTEEEHALLSDRPEFHGRRTHQFHWDSHGDEHFDGWLARFRSRRRKEVRRERKAAEILGAEVHVLPGAKLSDEQWGALHRFYRDTTDRKWAQAYLTEDFFEHARTSLSQRVVAFVAESDGRTVAGSLCFQRGKNLYGRYWGCEPGWHKLHFELCYHRPIATCIENGWTHFEAGAQGPHKIKRGLMPAYTFSAHHLRHRGLHDAVGEAVQQEDQMMGAQMHALSQLGPFHRTNEGAKS